MTTGGTYTVLSGTGVGQLAMLSPPPEGRGAPGGAPTTVVAVARSTVLQVWRDPGDPTPAATLASPNALGAPLILLVRQTAGSWVEAFLPLRPNEAVGWVRASDVVLKANTFAVAVRLDQRRLYAWHGGELLLSAPVAVGSPVTPTPKGVYYLTGLLKPPTPTGPYGPYAFGLSGYSSTLTSFNGGDGEVGLHGTNDPSSIGRDVTHGCIRLANAEIAELARALPLGTPVFVG